MNKKVVVIGCGNVGMSYAYALLNQKNSVHELVLIDIDNDKAQGEAMDLNHCLAFSPSVMHIKAGTYSDCKDATVVVIAAGSNQKVGETRMDLINKNAGIFKSIVESVVASGFNGIFLVATNPLDVMTYITYKYSKFNPNKVIGSGTSLDTARLRFIIGEKLQISPKNVHAYVMGEHGDSEFVAWSTATVGLNNINSFLTEEEMQDICLEVKNAAYKIIEKKQATYYGIGMCLARITSAILGDENSIITVSCYDDDNKLFIGKPAILNKNGIVKSVYVSLTPSEEQKMQESIDIIKKTIEGLEN